MLAQVKKAFGGSVSPKYKLRCAIWSPFRGDKLYPLFDDSGDYLALSRQYSVKEVDGTEVEYIRPIRERLERLLSNFADCIDRCFFPYLILEGEIHGTPQQSGKNRMIKITNGGKVYYLNWDQASDSVR